MLQIWVLNAGQGDSIVLRFENNGQSSFAVIDSNRLTGAPPPAITKLEALGAKELSFVALTHPHSDHYSGFREIFEKYDGKIKEFYTYPFGVDVVGRLKLLAEKYLKFIGSTDSETNHQKALEFIWVLKYAKDHFLEEDAWFELGGPFELLTPEGFGGVEIFSILPPRKVKGQYIQMIEKPDSWLEFNSNSSNINNLSAAFLIKYNGVEIILGGDGSYINWIDQKNRWQKVSVVTNVSVVKLPHHGSDKDCKTEILEHLFTANGKKYAIISAGGRKHPDKEVLTFLSGMKITPMCTNFSKHCGPNNGLPFLNHNVAPPLLRAINAMLEPMPNSHRACQGDICIEISDKGELAIKPELNVPCIYSQELLDLFSGIAG
ncbi:MBL fold metallo-hydrolase [Sedimenticola sp.]|uniref:MBL fold metallo-hydrolase n=1 Tax=Sedimenticola sp. TaxID=1940285 RepID=UPI003D0AAF53